MGFLIRNSRQQFPVNLLGVFFEQRLQVRQDAVYRAQEAAGVNVVKVIAVPEVLLLQTRQGTVFIDGVEEIKHRGREGLVVIKLAKPGHGLLVGDVQRHGDFRMHPLEQADRDRIGDGVGHLLIFYLLQQLRRAEFWIHRPAQVGIFLLLELPQIVNHHVAGRNRQLPIVNRGQRARAQAPDAVNQLL